MEKLLLAVESFLASPITWGLATLVLSAVALSGKFSVSAANWLLLFAWLTASFGIFRASPKEVLLRILVTTFFASGIAIAFLYLSRWFVQPVPLVGNQPAAQVQPASQSAEPPVQPPFKIERPRGFINLSQQLGDRESSNFWVTYNEDMASPVALAQYIDITNQLSIPQTIKSYSVAIKTDEVGWIFLRPIYIRGTRVWWTYLGLKEAQLMDFSANGLDYILEQPIQPHATISGWWFFDSKIKYATPRGSHMQYRVHLTTFGGVEFDYETLPTVLSDGGLTPGKSEGLTRGPEFIIPPGKPKKDISGFRRKLYSAPVQ